METHKPSIRNEDETSLPLPLPPSLTTNSNHQTPIQHPLPETQNNTDIMRPIGKDDTSNSIHTDERMTLTHASILDPSTYLLCNRPSREKERTDLSIDCARRLVELVRAEDAATDVLVGFNLSDLYLDSPAPNASETLLVCFLQSLYLTDLGTDQREAILTSLQKYGYHVDIDTTGDGKSVLHALCDGIESDTTSLSAKEWMVQMLELLLMSLRSSPRDLRSLLRVRWKEVEDEERGRQDVLARLITMQQGDVMPPTVESQAYDLVIDAYAACGGTDSSLAALILWKSVEYQRPVMLMKWLTTLNGDELLALDWEQLQFKGMHAEKHKTVLEYAAALTTRTPFCAPRRINFEILATIEAWQHGMRGPWSNEPPSASLHHPSSLSLHPPVSLVSSTPHSRHPRHVPQDLCAWLRDQSSTLESRLLSHHLATFAGVDRFVAAIKDPLSHIDLTEAPLMQPPMEHRTLLNNLCEWDFAKLEPYADRIMELLHALPPHVYALIAPPNALSYGLRDSLPSSMSELKARMASFFLQANPNDSETRFSFERTLTAHVATCTQEQFSVLLEMMNHELARSCSPHLTRLLVFHQRDELLERWLAVQPLTSDILDVYGYTQKLVTLNDFATPTRRLDSISHSLIETAALEWCRKIEFELELWLIPDLAYLVTQHLASVKPKGIRPKRRSDATEPRQSKQPNGGDTIESTISQ